MSLSPPVTKSKGGILGSEFALPETRTDQPTDPVKRKPSAKVAAKPKPRKAGKMTQFAAVKVKKGA